MNIRISEGYDDRNRRIFIDHKVILLNKGNKNKFNLFLIDGNVIEIEYNKIEQIW